MEDKKNFFKVIFYSIFFLILKEIIESKIKDKHEININIKFDILEDDIQI